MSMTAARNEIINKIRTETNWTHAISSEVGVGGSLPLILVDFVSSNEAMNFDGSMRVWDVSIELMSTLADRAGIDYHRDASNSNGLAAVLQNIQLTCSTLIVRHIDAESVKEELEDGSTVEWLSLEIGCTVYVPTE